MKTTVEIDDALFALARKHARRTSRTLRSLIEDGLRSCLSAEQAPRGYKLPDRSVGKADAPNPLERLSWQDLRDEIYEKR